MPIFKLLRGSHSEGVTKGANGARRFVLFDKGDIFESKYELDSKFNSPGSIKFERMPDGTPITKDAQGKPIRGRKSEHIPVSTAVMDDPFDDMTVEQLRQHAAEEEIDLGTATKKADIIALLRSA